MGHALYQLDSSGIPVEAFCSMNHLCYSSVSISQTYIKNSDKDDSIGVLSVNSFRARRELICELFLLHGKTRTTCI